ncbi:class I SAM-dependent methyltransferase [Roseococcus sp. SYP-B2431]|uniref:class I SAM-dependent methyltransferase n=1 Tax=Roseococcus sp. SYP-B2431 TaxID=2496640 RepID=UPI00103EAF0B|nr:class I SAM-dependent methyltransferase [Roseococcus sp. SYP-B2431]TCH97246.1 class I SAM-dependent methyltransferase [Roseococcus sp. SYP-B2431]
MRDRNAEMRQAIAKDWIDPPYYRDAEGWLDTFWAPRSPFLPLFRQLDLTRVIELACGHGRHAAQILDQAGEITLIDFEPRNIEACRRRFAGHGKLRYIVNAGNDLPGCEDGGYSALFCYDAMVHFELLDVIAYLRETHRVLRPGGRALLHVSNNRQNPGGFYQQNTHWRNFGSLDVFLHLADRLGFILLDSRVLDWPGAREIDGLMLLERPA